MGHPAAGKKVAPGFGDEDTLTDYSPYQQKVIKRYYDQRDQIMLSKLQELVTELYLAESEKKRDRLWERVAQAMETLKIPPRLAEHILTKRKPEVLAGNVNDWLKAAQRPRGGSSKR